MKWLKRTGVVIGVLIAILAVAPFFITLNDYIPRVEKEISSVLGEPVSIEQLHVSLLPVPRGKLAGIVIGRSKDIRIGALTVTPKLWSLFGADKVIRSVDVDDLALTQDALATLLALTKQKRSPAAVRVEQVRLQNATIKLAQSSVGPFDVHVQLSGQGNSGEITLTTHDKALKAHVSPERDHYRLELTARSWTMPIGAPIRFDELQIAGLADAKGATLSAIDGKLYGGTLAAKMTLRWEKGLAINGSGELRQIELKHAASLISPRTRVSGRLDAKPTFSSRAESAAQLLDALKLTTPFNVHDGVLYGFDLASAASSLGKKGTTSGETRFDELAGQLALERRTYRFTDLRIVSGGIAARGHVAIAPSRALSGQLNTTLKALGPTGSIPLTVTGTLDSPMVYPNATALAGAAAGTVLLGPGVGTAAGAKLGEFVDGIFGKKP